MTFEIFLSPPDVGPLEEEFVLDAIRSGWVAPLGPHVEGFEFAVAEMVGSAHAVALSSGTAALHLGLLALGVAPGDEVFVPTMTFAASAFAVTYCGARPVFVDSEPLSWNLDPDLLGTLLRQRAKRNALPAAVMVVDLYGQVADYDAILPICQEFEVPIIEDSAEALGARHLAGMAGALGAFGVFSFNGNKIMTTSGGGMLVTDDRQVASRVRHLATQAREPVPWYEHRDIGFNYRLSNVLAALGRAQLERLPSMIERRGHIRSRYRAGLAGLAITVCSNAPWSVGNNWLTVALCDDPEAPGQLLDALTSSAIESRPTWRPMHRQPVFSGCESWLNGTADRLYEHGLCLPSGSSLTDAEVESVIGAVAGCLAPGQRQTP